MEEDFCYFNEFYWKFNFFYCFKKKIQVDFVVGFREVDFKEYKWLVCFFCVVDGFICQEDVI